MKISDMNLTPPQKKNDLDTPKIKKFFRYPHTSIYYHHQINYISGEPLNPLQLDRHGRVLTVYVFCETLSGYRLECDIETYTRKTIKR